jgi:hypothetical protein
MVSEQQIHPKVSVMKMYTLSSATLVTGTTCCKFGFLKRNSKKTLKNASFQAKSQAKIKPKKQAKPERFCEYLSGYSKIRYILVRQARY